MPAWGLPAWSTPRVGNSQHLLAIIYLSRRLKSLDTIVLPAAELADANPLDVVARATRDEGADRTLWCAAGLCAVSVGGSKAPTLQDGGAERRRARWAAAEMVALRVGSEETALRQQVKPAGGVWNAQRKVGEVPYEQVVRLGLRGRSGAEEVI